MSASGQPSGGAVQLEWNVDGRTLLVRWGKCDSLFLSCRRLVSGGFLHTPTRHDASANPIPVAYRSWGEGEGLSPPVSFFVFLFG